MANLINITKFRDKKHSLYGSTYPLTKPLTIIGSQQKCDIPIVHQYISRQHAYILREGDNFYLGNVSKIGQEGVLCVKNVESLPRIVEVYNSFNCHTFREFLDKTPYKLDKECANTLNMKPDKLGLKRHYLFNVFMKDPENIERLIREESVLCPLQNNDKIIISRLFEFQFKK